MDLDSAFKELRLRNELVPKPIRLPHAHEVDEAEKSIGRKFHPDFRRYLLEVSDVVLGTLEPVTITVKGHTDLRKVVADAKEWGVPDELFPVCEDNADFYCLDQDGKVKFWSHNGVADEEWPNLADWITEVWIGESA